MKAAARAFLLAASFSIAAVAHAAEQRSSIVTAYGTLEPQEMADIYAPSSGGRVKSLGSDASDTKKAVTFGSHVKRNDVLVRLDSAVEEIRVEQAKAELRAAEAGLNLAKSQLTLAEADLLRKSDSNSKDTPAPPAGKNPLLDVARAKVHVAEATVDSAKAALQLANVRLAQCTLVSPIDGVIIVCCVNVGQTVSADLSLFLIAGSLDKLQVWASVGELDINRIAAGQRAKVRVEGSAKKDFTGRVSQIRLNAQPTQGEVRYTVIVDLDEAKGLLPYQSAAVSIDTAQSK